ncbi:MAG TPA: type IX secretion system outer membrane channel protein PorV, partial [Flavisolibacter sp.]|nr:type IX secretion system outer membrane channel protein PorV [Flavisolibacter sp.]
MRSTALKLTSVLTLLIAGIVPSVNAQQAAPINVVTTAVPFLRISPDGRAGAMGELALATSPDASSSYFNLGKVPFNESVAGANVTYTPWLKKLVNDVYLASLSGYYKLDEMQAISASLRYFNLGSIQFTDQNGNALQTSNPREFGFDLGYSRKLSDNFGVGVGLKYIYSNLASGFSGNGNTYKAGKAVAGDIGLYYRGLDDAGQGWAFGLALTNLGSKIAYTDNADQKDFIPANFGIGTTYTKVIDESNKISFGIDLNKLLVPTPPVASDPPTAQDTANFEAYRNKSVVGSWFSSFGDAPGGFSEEVKEFQASLGAEYWYNNQFALRAGYFHEDKTKGNRRYFTTGVGIKYNVFGLNFSYLIPVNSGVNQNPLANTLRFSLVFDLSG